MIVYVLGLYDDDEGLSVCGVTESLHDAQVWEATGSPVYVCDSKKLPDGAGLNSGLQEEA